MISLRFGVTEVPQNHKVNKIVTSLCKAAVQASAGSVWCVCGLLSLGTACAQGEGQGEERPSLETVRTELQQRRAQRIAEERAAGRIGSLEAEYRQVVNGEYANEQARREAVRAWHRQNGAALEEQRAAKRAQERLALKTVQAERRERRQHYLNEEVAAGRMGRLEAEFRRVVNGKYADEEARREAIRGWERQNGEALEAARVEKHAREKAELEAVQAERRERRQRYLNKEVAAGRMGRLEAEFRRVVNGEYADEEARREAIQEWRKAKGAALEAERDARR